MDERVTIALDRIHQPERFALAVCIPSGTSWQSSFGLSLAVFASEFASKRVPGYSRQTLTFINVQTSMIHASRQSLVERALIDVRATHILFVDSDQTFPKDVVHRLAKHGKMVVGANIVSRKLPMLPCAIRDGQKIWTREQDTGLLQVDACGTGLVLINTQVFGKIPPPFFMMPYEPENGGFVGEDVYFSRLLKAANIPVYIDHDVSKEVGHVGAFEYSLPLAWQQGDLEALRTPEGYGARVAA